MRTPTGNIQLRAENLADNEIDFERIVVQEQASGGKLRLGDVATVIDGFEDVRMSATANGVPAILFEVRPSERLFITKTSEQVNSWMAEKQSELPPGVELFSLHDEADSYQSRMDLIVKSAVMGLGLVLMILLPDSALPSGGLGHRRHCHFFRWGFYLFAVGRRVDQFPVAVCIFLGAGDRRR